MRNIPWLAGSLILALFACSPEVPSPNMDIDFGIYETLDPDQLPDSIRQELRKIKVQLTDGQQDAIAGLSQRNDQAWQDSLASIHLDSGMRFAVTIFEVNGGDEGYAVVALEDPSIIGVADIKEAIGETDRVVIRMTRQGAQKWAAMTERNTGRQVAFLLDGRIYNLPFVASTIRSGEALITGLETAEAGRIAGMLNGEGGS